MTTMATEKTSRLPIKCDIGGHSGFCFSMLNMALNKFTTTVRNKRTSKILITVVIVFTFLSGGVVLKRRSIPLWPTVLTLTAFAILCKLGVWQLQRAEEKRVWLKQHEQQNTVDINTIAARSDTDELAAFNGRQLTVKGEIMMPYVFFIDNKVFHGKAGYSVLAPVKISGSELILLADFGWVEAPSSRDFLPTVDFPKTVHFTGQLKTKQLASFTLEQQPLSDQWPQRIQSPHSALQLNLNETLLPLIVYAPSQTISGLPQTYTAVVMGPEKHQAYALQWFSLALASLLVFYFAALKPVTGRNKEETDEI
jgi:cytochrome oxidase assembly protein ShyY1